MPRVLATIRVRPIPGTPSLATPDGQDGAMRKPRTGDPGQGYGLSVRQSGFAGVLLMLGLAGGVVALVGDGTVLMIGLVLMVVATLGAGCLAFIDAKRRGRSVVRVMRESVREVFRWFTFLF